MSKGTSTLIAFLAGITAGLTVGVLYAPDRGKNTRDRLSYKLTKYRDLLKEYIEAIVEGKDTTLTSARSEGERVVNDAKERAEKLLGDVEDLIGQIKTKK
ncbi:MAG TPA: YtxH domain-containing protein [Cytophagales bacterium]|nr:YtxH domain-containing protein [Cytophagales bacterium]